MFNWNNLNGAPKFLRGVSIAMVPAFVALFFLLITDFGKYLRLALENSLFGRADYDFSTFVFIFFFLFIGFSQWGYLAPIKYYLRGKSENELAKGVTAGGKIVLLINLVALFLWYAWVYFLGALLKGVNP